MPEKEPHFTVTDRRKFTLDGELRPGAVPSEPRPDPQPAAEPVKAAPPEPVAEKAPQESAELPDETEEDLPPAPSAEESAEQSAAYKESSRTLDELIAKQNPRARASGEMTFDRLVQSIYMSAAIQLGAGAQPGEQPRVDILGARQSIDMLTVLSEKTKGNLTPNEERLLQNAVFELRMSFLELTNAIASSAHNPPPSGGPGRPGFTPGGMR